MSAWCCGNLLPKPDVAAIESEGADDVVSTNRETPTNDSGASEAQERAEREAQERAERENAYADRPLDFRPVGEEIYTVPEQCSRCRGNGGRYDPPYDLTAVFVECKDCNGSGWVYKRKTRTIYSGASSSSGYEVCPGCKGTGACICAGGKGLMHCKKCQICDGSATCVVCDGKGKRPANAYPIVSVDRCFGCFGLGRCGTCNGIGENHYGDCSDCQSDGTCGICDGTRETISFMDERGIYQRFSVNGKIR